MSNGSSGSSGDAVNRSRNWDHPNGLGWQVWRRTQSTGLLTQPIQRDLARLRANILNDPAPLASDIRRRWGVGGNTSVDRFGLDLPLFLGHSPFFRGSTSHHLSGLGPETVHRSTDTSRISLAHKMSRLSDETTLLGSPRTEADREETAQAMVPRSAGGSANAEPSPASLKQGRSEQNSSRFALTTTLTRQESLLPQG